MDIESREGRRGAKENLEKALRDIPCAKSFRFS